MNILYCGNHQLSIKLYILTISHPKSKIHFAVPFEQSYHPKTFHSAHFIRHSVFSVTDRFNHIPAEHFPTLCTNNTLIFQLLRITDCLTDLFMCAPVSKFIYRFKHPKSTFTCWHKKVNFWRASLFFLLPSASIKPHNLQLQTSFLLKEIHF